MVIHENSVQLSECVDYSGLDKYPIFSVNYSGPHPRSIRCHDLT